MTIYFKFCSKFVNDCTRKDMMLNLKQRLFIFARKNKIDCKSVHQILDKLHFPPTHSISPRMTQYPYIGPDGYTYYEMVPTDLRKRELSKDQYEKAMECLKDFSFFVPYRV